MTDEAVSAPEEDDGEQRTETLGSRLRSARESRDLSIEKIADELRIEEHVLHALEEDRLSDIQVAPVFIKGYIKQYGRLLELDYEELLNAFRSQADSEDVRLRPNRAILLRDERQITVWIIAALAVLLVAVALFVWWLGDDGLPFVRSGAAGDDERASVAAPVTSRAVPPSTRQAVADAIPEPPAPPAETEVAEQADNEQVPADVASAESVAADVSPQDGTADAGEVIASQAIGAQIVDAAAAEPEPGAVAMVFEFARESWFELTDARGRRLHYDLADAGSRLSFMALPPARVVIGDADAVSITVASNAHPVPASSLRGNVASFVIDPAQD
jgi:cytoskeleton protein RodZ